MKVIKDLRIENNLTQKELADKLGVTNKSVWAYENGYAVPPIETLIKLADTFNCTVDYLVGREQEYTIINFNQEVLSTTEEFELVRNYRKLSARDKFVVSKLINNLIENRYE